MQLLDAPQDTSAHAPLKTTPGNAAVAALAPAGELTIYAASELRAQWLDWLAALEAHPDQPPPALQAGGIDLVDAAGLQLLLALDLALARRGHALRIAAPSTALVAALDGMGLGEWLQARTAQEATP